MESRGVPIGGIGLRANDGDRYAARPALFRG
jgi:hypothetical protein